MAAVASRLGRAGAAGASDVLLRWVRESVNALLLGARASAAGAAGRRDERRERVAQPRRVLVGKVDLVRLAVERERHRAGRLGTVEVVDEPNVHLLSHLPLPSAYVGERVVAIVLAGTGKGKSLHGKRCEGDADNRA